MNTVNILGILLATYTNASYEKINPFIIVILTIIIMKLMQFAYFYGSTVKRTQDITCLQVIDGSYKDYILVHLFASYLFTSILNQYINLFEFNINFIGKTLLLVISGIYVADFIAGFVHFLGDVTQEYHFIYHHEDPVYICGKSYVHHTIDSYKITVPIYLILNFFVSQYPVLWLLLQFVMIVAVQGNEFHHYAHCQKKEIGPIISFLQDYNLFISAKSHKNHHQPPYNKHYCTVTGWANPLLNLITIPTCGSNFIQNKYPPQIPATKTTYDPLH